MHLNYIPKSNPFGYRFPDRIGLFDDRKYRVIAVEGIDGAGKTTAINRLFEHLRREKKVKIERLSPVMVEIFKSLYDYNNGETGDYQSFIPPEFRMASYIIEASIQFHLNHKIYNRYDVLIFDRWMQTNLVYLGDVKWNKPYFDMLMSFIPQPDIVFYMNIGVDEAIQRLQRKNDWMTNRYTEHELYDLLSEIKKKFDKYVSDSDCIVIDANCTEDDVFLQMLSSLKTRKLI